LLKYGIELLLDIASIDLT